MAAAASPTVRPTLAGHELARVAAHRGPRPLPGPRSLMALCPCGLVQTDLDPAGELLLGGESIVRDGDPARSHGAIGAHDRGLGTGDVEELVVSCGVDADEQVAVTAGRDDHAVVHQERQAAEHRPFTHWAVVG